MAEAAGPAARPRCARCNDDVQWQPEREYWMGLATGGECPNAPLTEHELVGGIVVLDNAHVVDGPQG